MSSSFDILGIVSQAVAIMSHITGIRSAFDYDEMPGALNEEDLPAAVPLIGPMPYRDYTVTGGKASDGVDEAQDIILRVYVTPTTQGYTIGDAIKTSGTFIGLVLAAFDGRPKLINADGNSSSDFAYATAGLALARIVSCTGVVIRPYSNIDYFTVEFTLRCDGRRKTDKVEGN